ncbi:MAG: hypothetical protein LBS20_09515 [Prevotella sp.]|jgi:hypothetical protein|nr:hypothetical protein [Prevotella sp.]
MKKQLDKDELKKLSGILNIENDVLLALSDRNLLNYSQARALLIKSEYDKLIQDGKNKKCRIMTGLANKYGVSKSYIEIFIYNKSGNKCYHCSGCRRRISCYQFRTNEGKCKACKTNHE